MGITEVVKGDEESLGMSGKEKVEKKNRGEDGKEQHSYFKMEKALKKNVHHDSDEAARAVIDDPSGG
jgi:hypothetical protein